MSVWSGCQTCGAEGGYPFCAACDRAWDEYYQAREEGRVQIGPVPERPQVGDVISIIILPRAGEEPGGEPPRA